MGFEIAFPYIPECRCLGGEREEVHSWILFSACTAGKGSQGRWVKYSWSGYTVATAVLTIFLYVTF